MALHKYFERMVHFLLLLLIPSLLFSQSKELNLKLHFQEGNGPFDYINFPVRWKESWTTFRETFPITKGLPSNLKEIERGIICLHWHTFQTITP